MTILSGQTIRKLCQQGLLIQPFVERQVFQGMSYGLSSCGYDIRIRQSFTLSPGKFALASSGEQFRMPNDVVGMVHDKSTWARRGLAVQNTVIEPGWEGFLTLELTNHGEKTVFIEEGMPIAQIVFHWLDQPAEAPYAGKYQNQPNRPVEAIDE